MNLAIVREFTKVYIINALKGNEALTKVFPTKCTRNRLRVE